MLFRFECISERSAGLGDRKSRAGTGLLDARSLTKAPDGIWERAIRLSAFRRAPCRLPWATPVPPPGPPGQRRKRDGWEVAGWPSPVTDEGLQGRGFMIGIMFSGKGLMPFLFRQYTCGPDVYSTLSQHTPEPSIVLGMAWRKWWTRPLPSLSH